MVPLESKYSHRLVLGRFLLGAAIYAGPTASLAASGSPLRWTAPDGCMTQRDIDAALHERGVEGRPGRNAVAFVTQEATGDWRLELVLEEADAGRQVRTVHAHGCDKLAEVAVLIVAIAHGEGPRDADVEAQGQTEALRPPELAEPPATEARPGSASRGIEVSQPEHSQVEGRTPEASAVPRSARTNTRARRGLGGDLMVAAGPGLRVMPRTTGVVEARFALRGRGFRVELAASVWIPIEAPLSSQYSARYFLGTATVRGCWVARWARVQLPLCGAVETGAMVATGRSGLNPTRTARYPWVAGRVGPAVIWAPYRHFALWCSVDLLVPFVRPRFGTDSRPDLYVVPGVSVIPLGGVAARFP